MRKVHVNVILLFYLSISCFFRDTHQLKFGQENSELFNIKLRQLLNGDFFYPQEIRYYVSHRFIARPPAYLADVEFRWDPPLSPAFGGVANYTVFWRFMGSLSKGEVGYLNATVESKQRWFRITDRKLTDLFEFQIQVNGFEKTGNKSKPIRGLCAVQNPVSKLLMASPESIHLFDQNFEKPFEVLFKDATTELKMIKSICYIAYREELFWIDGTYPASITRMLLRKGTKPEKLVYVDEDADFITVDWVQLVLYWVENKGQSIYMFDLVREVDVSLSYRFKINVFTVPHENERIISLVVDPWLQGLLTFVIESDFGERRIDQLAIHNVVNSFWEDPVIVEQSYFGIYPANVQNELARRENSSEQPISDCSYEETVICSEVIGSQIGPQVRVDSLAPEDERLIITTSKKENSRSSSSSDEWTFVKLSADGCKCKSLHIVPRLPEDLDDLYGKVQLTMSSLVAFTVDSQSVTWLSKPASGSLLETTFLNSVNKTSGTVFKSSEIPFTLQTKKELTHVAAYGQNLQPLPPELCLIPRNYSVTPVSVNRTHNSLTIHFPRSFDPSFIDNPQCSLTKMPTVVYTVYYGLVKSTNDIYPKCGSTSADLREQTSSLKCSFIHLSDLTGQNLTIPKLQSNTMYVFQIGVTNHFAYQFPKLSPPLYLSTSIGPPSDIRDCALIPLVPSKLVLTFRNPVMLNGPEDLLRFKIIWCDSSSCGPENISSVIFKPDMDIYSRDDRHTIILKDLSPDKMYAIGVTAFHEGFEHLESTLRRIRATTFAMPESLKLQSVTCCSLTVSWNPVDFRIIETVYVSIFEKNGDSSDPIDSQVRTPSVDNGAIYNVHFSNLDYFTDYKVQLKVLYVVRASSFQSKNLPAAANTLKDDSLVVKTLPGPPGAPQRPHLLRTSRNRLNVVWQRPEKLNCPENSTVSYNLQSCIVGRSTNFVEANCSSVYEGNETSVDLVVGRDILLGLFLRVQVTTEFGTSEFSKSINSSLAQTIPGNGDFSQQTTLGFFGLNSQAALIACGFSGLFFLIFLVSCRNSCAISSFKKTRLSESASSPGVPLTTMQTRLSLIQQAPFKAENDVLYYVGTNYTGHKKFDSLQGLSIIKADYIRIDNLIGSGAFGEVFSAVCSMKEGFLLNARIAVKFLSHNAAADQKQDFMQEAILMRNFEHPNIVEVYGICLDSEPIGIIMELMDSDLLTFLRQSRPEDDYDQNEEHVDPSTTSLTIRDQIMIAIDIANGCNYLSEHHMLHRDLAARNCLVSRISDPNLIANRADCDYIVKVGDFGLARDVYKQEYYRKTGNALMPVRWMSPESLIDGIFTSQSDVWSYGVVFWEIMTLGNQPYPGKDNVDVLHYVKSGGRLVPPQSCVPELGQLMENCWNSKPSKRPTFLEILEFLDAFLNRVYFTSEDVASDHNVNSEENTDFYSPIYITPSSFDVSKDANLDLSELETSNAFAAASWGFGADAATVRRFKNRESNSQTNYSAVAVKDGLTDDISSVLSSAISVAAVSQNELYHGENGADLLSRSYMRVCNQLRKNSDLHGSNFNDQFSDSVAGAFSCNSVYLSEEDLGVQNEDIDRDTLAHQRRTLTASTPMERKHKPADPSADTNYYDTKSYQNIPADLPLLGQSHPKSSNYVIKNGYAMLPKVSPTQTEDVQSPSCLNVPKFQSHHIPQFSKLQSPTTNPSSPFEN